MPNLLAGLFGRAPSTEHLKAEAEAILKTDHSMLGIETEPRPVFKPAVPVPKYFLEGERLWPPKSLASLDSRTLIGEVAQLLGRCVSERYEWDRPLPIKTDAIAGLLTSPALQGQSLPEWELRADAHGTGVQLLLRAGGRVVESTEVLDLRKIPPGMVVMNVDAGLESLQQALSTRFNGEGHTEGMLSLPMALKHHASHARPLHGLPRDMRLMVLGHGGRGGLWPQRPGQPYAVNRVGGMSVTRLADRLVTQGLEKTHAGVLYLEACDSAAGFSTSGSFAQALQAEMMRRGYRHLTVSGTPGVTFPDLEGHNYSEVSALTNDHRQALHQSHLKLERLRAQLSERKALALSGQPMPLAVRRVAPGARLPGLEKAIRREEAYADQIRQLGRINELERQKVMSSSDASRRRHFLTGVRDWWGHFGARGGPSPLAAPVAPAAPVPTSWWSRQWGRLFGRGRAA